MLGKEELARRQKLWADALKAAEERHHEARKAMRTAKPRLRAKLEAIREECLKRRHLSIVEQGTWLRSVVQRYFNYHAVPTNIRSLAMLRDEVTKHWRHALRRRSQRGTVPRSRMHALAVRWLPAAKILHPWPHERFASRLQGKSPVR